ncbi:MAG: hypothetical protein ACPGXK_01910 [Phycisphaerae bacterium]
MQSSKFRRACQMLMGVLLVASPSAVTVAADDKAPPQQSNRPTEKQQNLFRTMLNGAILEGTWQMTMGDPIKGESPLTDPRPEKYTISKVEKGADDYWIITARIQYADKDVEVPVLVRVVWAGDTPIITVDDLPVPLIGTYSARVMVYGGYYAGTWFGKGYGGVLSGRITHPKNQKEKHSEGK